MRSFYYYFLISTKNFSSSYICLIFIYTSC
nr:MAG TPA: hypothetical protein [Crassvirales sp.]